MIGQMVACAMEKNSWIEGGGRCNFNPGVEQLPHKEGGL